MKEVGWVQRFDTEAMKEKAEDALKVKKTRTDNECEEGHMRKSRPN
jgi:hypothetical protein